MIQFYRAQGAFGFLSNYYAAPMLLDGLLWPTVEHYFQAQKFPHDEALREKIRTTPAPDAAKRVAWQQSDVRSDWNSLRDDVMRTALRAKFGQHADLRAALLATGHAQLVEHTERDAYWGDGGDGSGVSRMSDLLDAVRAELAAQAQPSVNREILDWLLSTGQIEITDSPFLRTLPAAHVIAWPRAEGMLLGLAIGDALGNVTEAQLTSLRHARHGEVRDYLPNRYADMQPCGVPSDDSQLAFWTLEQMLHDNALVPESLATIFSNRQIFGIGETVDLFITAYKQHGMPWYRAAQPSAGNGALMRVAPVLIPYLHAPSAELWADTTLAAMITHNDTASIASCCAFVAMLWDLLAMDEPPAAAWWTERFVQVVRALETATTYKPRSPLLPQKEQAFSDWIDALLSDPALADRSTLAACNRWYSGAYLLETVPSALLILQRYAHDPEEAIVRAVNDTRDNDTVAAIVGAAVGALHGADALPTRWRDGLLGRLGADDDGALFALINEARARWG